jgi:hypothetical protein
MRLGLRRVRPAQDVVQPAAQRAAATVEPPAPATASTASSSAASAAPVAPAAPAPPTPASEASQDAAEPTPSLAAPARAVASPAESSAAAGASALAESVADRASAPAADKPKKRGWLGFMRRSAPEKPEVDIPVCCKCESAPACGRSPHSAANLLLTDCPPASQSPSPRASSCSTTLRTSSATRWAAW